MSTQPEPSVAAARSSRSRSRSRSRSEAETMIEVDSEVEEIATIDVPELLQTPQIAPGIEHHRFDATDEYFIFQALTVPALIRRILDERLEHLLEFRILGL